MSIQPFDSPDEFQQFVLVCRRFEDAFRKGERPSIDDELAKWLEPKRSHVRQELLDLERHHLPGPDGTLNEIDLPKDKQTDEPPTPATTDPLPASASPKLPAKIGRYRVIRILGEGSFGRVYLAQDEELDRAVAIKVPLASRVARPQDVGEYLKEARTLASLSHPNIVAVFDAGRTENGHCFVVSNFIEGTDLSKKLKEPWLSFVESANLVATVADALHYAHHHGLVHRDVKPANILIAVDGTPILADFGLALKDADFGKGAGFAGTPAYMSPEQANSEGHRVDGRSDIFSLGVVCYELLTRVRPFKADSVTELLDQIAVVEARPPRQINDTIPKELERICLKALSKRVTDRYTTAKDMADDLRHFVGEMVAKQPVTAPSVASEKPPLAPSGLPSAPVPPSSDNRPIKIVPKGLSSFDAHDADFFLELLPGARDRDGLPDSIRFWKTRIEEKDADSTFSVGLIYGPSGCGKSSLVKAGLLPRLSADVIAVYVEATGEDTETRLLNGLRKRCPTLGANLTLKATLTLLRRGQAIPPGKKVLIFLDQFEQWLHARKDQENTELVQALRQCDGAHVQTIVMVRDDFWMAATRFMRELEVRLVEGQNSGAVDLFDMAHARKVLASFGRAFGKLPEKPGDASTEQKQFLTQAISGLSQEGKVISVRLSLFAEMMKGKTWTLASLKAVGGTEGVGVTFLEETFSAGTAPPEHRYHQKAARGVLKALLPESGTDIKGHMRSHDELLEASGYRSRPRDFDELIRILDSEVRLITPTDPGGKEEVSASSLKEGEKYYQLTHDYLVPSLRDWLTRKQKETRRGRAELLLADRAGVWNARQENRQLPSLRQWVSIRWLTAKKNWTPPQKKMMAKASRYHAVRGVVSALLLAVGTITSLAIREKVEEQRQATHAAGLVQAVLNANTAQVLDIIEKMSEYRKWADPLLRKEYDKASANSRQRLHASLALLPVDATQVDYLYNRLLDAAPNEVPVIRDALAPHKDDLLDKLWAVVEKPEKGKESQRLRAASALAKFDPESDKWAKAGSLVVNDLVMENPVFLGQWSEAFRPVKNRLLPRLSEIFRDHQPERTAERSLATNILADYAADQPQVLADLLMDADEKQFAVIYPKFKEQGDKGLPLLTTVIDTKLPADLPSSDDKREKLAKRQANAAVAWLKLNQPEKVWPLLKHSPDPMVRSYLIHRLGPLGADAGAVVRRLDEETDITIRRALLLSLGEFDEKEFSQEDRQGLLPKLQEIYRTDTDPGLRAASEWLLRTWKQEAWLKQVNEEWAKDKEKREKKLDSIKQLLTKDKEKTPPQWYVNGQGQTMVVIPGQVKYQMGSPKTEKDRGTDEVQHQRRIGRTFVLAAKSVTLAEYRSLTKDKYEIDGKYTRLPDLPVVGINWYMAAAYCNMLSKAEGIEEDQWCYEIKGKETKLKAGYLSLTGYRLPTEAEMEYATRALAVTSRYYGETDELLGNYAWYSKNSNDVLQRVGTKKPNDFGLFDVQGNCYTWCQEPFVDGYKAVEDKEAEELMVISTSSRVLRGGSFNSPASLVRSAARNGNVPAPRASVGGFRPARTFLP